MTDQIKPDDTHTAPVPNTDAKPAEADKKKSF